MNPAPFNFSRKFPPRSCLPTKIKVNASQVWKSFSSHLRLFIQKAPSTFINVRKSSLMVFKNYLIHLSLSFSKDLSSFISDKLLILQLSSSQRFSKLFNLLTMKNPSPDVLIYSFVSSLSPNLLCIFRSTCQFFFQNNTQFLTRTAYPFQRTRSLSNELSISTHSPNFIKSASLN